jgi:outer membrane receptor for ferrienterochelin and colicins
MKRHIYFYLLSIILTTFSYQINAQNIDFEGKVMCGKKPISFAVVSVKELKQAVQTNQDGKFIFKNLSKDTFLLNVKALGYYPKQIKIIASNYKNRDLIIEVIENENTLNDVVVSGTLKEISKKESTVSV